MIHAQEILNIRKRLNEIYVKHTGQAIKKIEDALERDQFFTAEGARDFGLVDKVIEKRFETPEKVLISNRRRVRGRAQRALGPLGRAPGSCFLLPRNSAPAASSARFDSATKCATNRGQGGRSAGSAGGLQGSRWLNCHH